MSEPAEPTTPASASADAGSTPPTAAKKPKREFLGRTSRLYHKLHLPPIKSRRGILMIVLLVAGFGSIITLVGLKAVSYSESAAFCSKCHQMGPEMAGYQRSVHSELPCADCHVASGVGGFLKAKIKGTQQLIEVVTGTFPKPIPAPDHSALPPVSETCLKCHSLANITRNSGPIQLVLRQQFLPDKHNTPQTVAVALRPQGLPNASGVEQATLANAGVHWHVVEDVQYTSSDVRSQTIDYIKVTRKDGTVDQFISASALKISGTVLQEIDQLKGTQHNRTMTCLDCHNRAGHNNPSPDQAVDAALTTGAMSTSLPYLKREAVSLLNEEFTTIAQANSVIDSHLRSFYKTNYPAIAKKDAKLIDAAIITTQQLYESVATPEMKVYAKTYPDNLGHQRSPGCFRCHDGAHFKVINGQVTNQTIPWSCNTCHTFPQTGGGVNVMMQSRPASHQDPLWVFNHKYAEAAVASARLADIKHESASVDPAGTLCGTCHNKQYCENCHKSGAINVSHKQMLFNHAAVIRNVGSTTACAQCHQNVTCAQCHKGTMLVSKLNS